MALPHDVVAGGLEHLVQEGVSRIGHAVREQHGRRRAEIGGSETHGHGSVEPHIHAHAPLRELESHGRAQRVQHGSFALPGLGGHALAVEDRAVDVRHDLDQNGGTRLHPVAGEMGPLSLSRFLLLLLCTASLLLQCGHFVLTWFALAFCAKK